MIASPERIDLRVIAPQPWKNGAGLTREVASCGPGGSDGSGTDAFDWRISVAEVERDAPFSVFPGVDRCIVLLRGAGLRLVTADGSVDHALDTPYAPFRFSGDLPVHASLLGGASTDLNVMTRRGMFRSDVIPLQHAAVCEGAAVTLAFCISGSWQVDGGEAMTLHPMQALLWRQPIDACRVAPLGGSAILLLVRLFEHPG